MRPTALLMLLMLVPVPACKEGQKPTRKDPGLQQVPAPAPAAGAREDRLTLLTYNVLANPGRADQRIPPLIRLLERSGADIIALQEVAPWFLRKLSRHPWARAYHPTIFNKKVAGPGGQFILSRFPIKRSSRHLHPGPQRRVLVIAEVLVRGEVWAVATTHMESFLKDGPIRARQLDQIFEQLSSYDRAVVLGDFNFGDGEQPETGRLAAGYTDVWTALKPDRPGYTWDIEKSEMAKKGSFPGEKSRRIDRILFRSSGWRPASVKIIGDQPVIPGELGLFPSDHFGLVGVLEKPKK